MKLCRERRDFCIAPVRHHVHGCALPVSRDAPCLAQHQLPGRISEGADDVGLLIVMSAVLGRVAAVLSRRGTEDRLWSQYMTGSGALWFLWVFAFAVVVTVKIHVIMRLSYRTKSGIK